MIGTDTISCLESGPASAAPGPAPDALAIPDASGAALPDAPTLDSALLAVTPPLNHYFDEMCAAIADRRVIIVRQQGSISVGSLLAFLGAFLMHVAFAILVYFMWKIIIASPWAWGPQDRDSLVRSGGRSGPTFAMLREGELTGTDNDSSLGPYARLGITSTPAPIPAAPVLPDPHTWAPVTSPMQADDTPLIGMPTDLDPPAPKVIHPPTRLAAAPEAPQVGPVIVGPNSPHPASDSGQASGTPRGAVAAPKVAIARGSDRFGSDPDDDDGQHVIGIMRGDGGTGRGLGADNGDGPDRGASGANNEVPQLLSLPSVELPLKQMVTRPRGKVVFDVQVLSDDTIGQIKLVQGCGDPTVDAVCKDAVARAKFRAAYRGGKTFTAWYQGLTFLFGSED